MNDKEEILNILGSLIEADGAPSTEEKKSEAAIDDSGTEQDKVPGELNPNYIKRYLMWIERITKFNEDAIVKSANKIGLAISKALKAQVVKAGPTKYSFNPPNDEEGKFYEVLRWEVKDEIKYRMYTVDKMKKDELAGQATEKVLGSLLGGVKLPSVDYAAQIKYNPEYLQEYNRLMGFLTKTIVENNKSIANHNKETSEEGKKAEEEASPLKGGPSGGGQLLIGNNAEEEQKQLTFAGRPQQKAITNKQNQPPSIADKSSKQQSIAAGTRQNQIGYEQTKSVAGTNNVAQITQNTSAVAAKESFDNLLNDILMEADVKAAGTLTSKGVAAASHGGAAISNRFSAAWQGVVNVGKNLWALRVPGVYNIIGYDFGYVNGKRLSTPKIFKKKNIRNVAAMLQFIENSHVYEDMSGKLKDVSSGKKADMHQVKPVKMLVYRLPKSNMFKDINDNQILDPDEKLTPEQIDALDNGKITDVLQLLPMGTLAVAFWGRLIKLEEINEAREGEKVAPEQIFLTAKPRPEWYFFIPAANKKVDQKPIEDAKNMIDDPAITKALTLIPNKGVAVSDKNPGPNNETGVNAVIVKAAKGELITAKETSEIKDLIASNPEQAKEIKSKAATAIPNLTDELMVGLGDNKTPSEMKSIYRKASIKYHPDKADTSPEAQKAASDKFAKLNSDYNILKKMGLSESSIDTFKLLMKHILG